MKLYSLDCKPINYEDLSKNPYIGEIEGSFEIYEVIRTEKGDFVSGIRDFKNDCAGVHRIDQLNLEIGAEKEYEQNIICPCCGHENIDSWECGDSDDNHQCGQCGATLETERIVTVEYSSKLVKLPDIARAKFID